MHKTHLALIHEDMVADDVLDSSGKRCVSLSFTITTHISFTSFKFSVFKRNKYVINMVIKVSYHTFKTVISL